MLNGPAFLAHPQAAANGLPVEMHDALGRQLQVGRFVQCASTAADAAPLGSLDGAGVSGAGPLHGVRVIDVSRAAAGPICGRVLADLGAEVVRAEDPDGEHSRQVGLTFAGNNRNKLSLGLDLTKPEGLDALARITEQSDVVLTNALPAASARLGIDYATVAARNPATIHISILGFGRRPPFGGRRVVDAAAQACLLNTSAFVQLFGLTDPPPPGGRLDEDRWGYAADQRLYQARDGWICVAAASPAARQAFAAALGLDDGADAGAGRPGRRRRFHPGRAGAVGLPAEPRLLGRYGLAARRDALIESGAMRSEPGPVTLQASSV